MTTILLLDKTRKIVHEFEVEKGQLSLNNILTYLEKYYVYYVSDVDGTVEFVEVPAPIGIRTLLAKKVSP